MKQKWIVSSIITICIFAATSCLKTRADVGETSDREEAGHQTASNQKAEQKSGHLATVEVPADQSVEPTKSEGPQDPDTQDALRALNGRIETLEAKLKEKETNDPEKEALKKDLADSQAKVNLLQEELTKLQAAVQQLQNEDAKPTQAPVPVANGKAAKDGKTAAPPKDNKPGGQAAYDVGQKYFDKKDWKQAILSYQRYRETTPKGSQVADATYKIGVSFQELGMKDEARTFYDDVVNNHPKSEAAKKARIRLKSLNK